MRKKRIPIIDLIFLIILGLLYWKPFVFNVSTVFDIAIPLDKQSFGIDVSHHQGTIDWDTLITNNQIVPKIDFVFVKSTEGINHVDSQLELNSKALQRLKVPFGAYHFFRSEKSSIAQSKHFLNQSPLKKTSLPPVLDVEVESTSAQALKDSVKVWLHQVELHSGKRPIIYCSWSYFKTFFQNDFSDYKFWIARYSSTVDFENYPEIIYWQFTDQAQLPYHQSTIDLNVSPVKFD